MGMASLYLSKAGMVFGGSEVPPSKAVALIVGIPYDFTSSYRPGSRFGPQAIRTAAANIEFYSLRASRDVDDYGVSDLGDIILPISPRDALRRIEEVIYEIMASHKDKLLLALGGEHTITIATYAASKRVNNNVCLLVFDAHLDLRDQYMEDPLSHACVLRRIVERYGPSNVMVVGVRAFSREELEYARRMGIEYVTPIDLRLIGVRGVVTKVHRWIERSNCSSLYTSIDMDVFDPAYAPGVGNPEPEGLAPWQLYDILYKAVLEPGIDILAADIVEVSPPHDCNGITSILAAKTAVELIALKTLVTRKQHK